MKKTITFFPTRAAMMLAVMLCCLTGARAEELTVYDGTDNNEYIPVYGYYTDTKSIASEFVIPSGQLTAMAGGTISGLKFYLKSSAAAAWTATFKVYLKEIDGTTLTGITGPDACTVVYTGNLDATGSEMTVTFDTPYIYEGDNLLIGTYVYESGNDKSASFYGVNQSENTAWYRSSASAPGGAKQFIPKTTFTYTPGSGAVYKKPTNLTVSNLTSSGATISWSAPEGSPTGYAYQYKKAADNDWSPEATTTATSVSISSLAVSTTYNFRVKAVYSEGESGFYSKNFTTSCGAYDIPYTYGFEEDTPFNCWTVISGNNTRYYGTANSGSYRLNFRGNTDNMIVLPQFNDATNTLCVEFYTRPERTDGNSGKFAIGYMTDINDASTFVAVETYNSTEMTTSFVKKTVYFNNAPTNAYIAMRQYDCTTNYYWYVDDVEVSLIPSCISPTGLTASNVTLTSATLSWTERGFATAWVLQYGTDKNFATNTYTEITVSTNPTTNLTGLTTESVYYARVKPECDTEGNNWSDVISFWPTATEEITLNGDGGTSSICPISGPYVNTDTKSQFIIPATALEDVDPGSKIKRMYFYSSSPSVDWGDATFKVYMKEVDYETFATASFEDWESPSLTNVYSGSLSVSNSKMEVILDNDGYIYNGGNLLIGFKLDNPGTKNSVWWVLTEGSGNNCVYSYNDGSVNWINWSTSLPKVSLRFLQGEETCKRPKHLTVSDVTAHGATINWESDADAWQIMLDDDAQNLIDVNEKTYTFTGLDTDRTYTAKVRTNCGSDSYSAWSIAATFKPSECFTIGSGTDHSCYLPTYNYYEYSLTQQIYTVAELGGAGLIESIAFYKDVVNTCERDLDIYMVSTSKSSFDSENDWISVTDADLVFSGTVTFADNDWTSITLNNAFIYNGTQNVAIIVADNTGDYDMSAAYFLTYSASEYQSLYYYQDSYDIDPSKPSASYMYYYYYKNQIRITKSLKPTNLMATKVGPNQATLTWVETGAATEWVVAYKKTGDATFTEVNATTNPYTLTGLSNETAYIVKVRPANDDDLWSRELTFNTTVDNPVPTDVTVSDIKHKSATVNWTGFGESYNVRYGVPFAIIEQGFENGLGSWTMQNQESSTGVIGGATHSGSNGFMFSFNSNPPQYLLSPELTIVNEGTLLEFYYRNHSSNYPETFQVGFSSTTNSTDAFTFGDEITAADEQWHLYQGTVPAGTKYICWKLTSDNQYYFFIDDIVVSVTTDWTNTSVTEESISLEGLTAGTTYQCQVQSVKGGETSDWSPVATFTTLPVVTLTENDGVTNLTANMSGQKNVPVKFSRSFTSGVASTICLPFPMTNITGGKVYEFVNVDWDDTFNNNQGGWVATMVDATPSSGNEVTSTTADKPYLFMPSTTGAVTFTGTIAEVASSYTPVPTTSGYWTFRGTYSKQTYSENAVPETFSGTVFGFAASATDAGAGGNANQEAVEAGEFVRAISGAYIPAFRAFLKYSGNDTYLKARGTRSGETGVPEYITVRLISKSGEIDGIGEVRLSTGEVTFDSNAWYDMNGRKLDGKPTVKGIYINGNKKVVIK